MSSASPAPPAAKASSDPLSTPDIFPPDEEQQLLEESTTEKTTANRKFTSGDYSSAIQVYEKALAVCPNYLEYDIAVLRSNIAACHLKLEGWKEAVESATQAIDALERVDPLPKPAQSGGGINKRVQEVEAKEEERVEEIDDNTEIRIEALNRTGKSIEDVRKLRTKALLRRAKARREVGGWASLQGAEEDYRQLNQSPNLAALDRKTVQTALRELPAQLEEAKNKEMGEMMGKLKQLGNGILKPFGLSTDNFNFVKDQASGGYSMQFNQGAGGKG